MERATGLLLEITGGEAGPVIEVVSEQHLPSIAPVTLRASRVEQMLGLVIENAEIERLLKGLGLAVTAEADGQWRVEVPSHRFDISLEVDLIEELARLYGYNRLPVRYPQARLAPQAKAEAKGDLPELRRLLVARGYQEAITYSFIDPKWFELFSPGAKPLLLANPISNDMAAMRASLWPGLVKALQHNLNRQQDRVRMFESGLRFVGQLDGLKQEPMLAGVVCGSRLPEGWAQGRDVVDFFDVKADVEAVLGFAGALGEFTFTPGQHPALHPGQTARIERDGREVGFLGAIHPNCRKPSAWIARCLFSSWFWRKCRPAVCLNSMSCRASLKCAATWRCWPIRMFRPVRFWTLFVKMQASGSQTSGYLMFTRVKALIRIEKPCSRLDLAASITHS